MFPGRSRPQESTDRRMLSCGRIDGPSMRSLPASRESGLSPEEHTWTGTFSRVAGTRQNFVHKQMVATSEMAKSTTAHENKDTVLNSPRHCRQPHMTIPDK
jgi:hypothetical protein